MQNTAAEMKIRAQRKGGKLIANLEISPGKRNDLTRPINGTGSTKEEEIKRSGMNVGVAGRWEKIASVPADKFEQHISVTKKKTAFCYARFSCGADPSFALQRAVYQGLTFIID